MINRSFVVGLLAALFLLPLSCFAQARVPVGTLPGAEPSLLPEASKMVRKALAIGLEEAATTCTVCLLHGYTTRHYWADDDQPATLGAVWAFEPLPGVTLHIEVTATGNGSCIDPPQCVPNLPCVATFAITLIAPTGSATATVTTSWGAEIQLATGDGGVSGTEFVDYDGACGSAPQTIKATEMTRNGAPATPNPLKKFLIFCDDCVPTN